MAIAMAGPMLALAALPAGGESPRGVALGHSLVRLGDLMDLTSVPARLRERAALIEIVRFRSQAAPLIVRRSFLLQRIRVQVPQLGGWGEAHVKHSYALSYHPAAVAGHSGCLRALHDVAEGDVLRSDTFALAECESDGRERSFRYVAAERAVRSRRVIVAGTIVPRFAGYGVTDAYPGDRMTLVASVGSVRIERETRAMQSARRSERMFVRTVDGEVLSVPYADAGQ